MATKRRRWKPTKYPDKQDDKLYRQLWRVIDGAVADAFAMHPEYLAVQQNRKTVRQSIVKRVTGAMRGYVGRPAQGRSGESPATVMDGSRSREPFDGPMTRPSVSCGSYDTRQGFALTDPSGEAVSLNVASPSVWEEMWSKPFDFSQESKS